MVFNHRPILRKDKVLVMENVKQAKQYVEKGTLSQEDFDRIVNSFNPKYVGWVSKIWIKDKPDFDDLRNRVEEYNTFVNRGKAKTRDINAFKSFADLKAEVNDLNDMGAGISAKDLESDYETIQDDENLLIKVPHTHEASRKLGLSDFAFRKCKGGGKDSRWCTTYKSPDHFRSYYYTHGVTFYYVKVRSEALQQELKKALPERYPQILVTAIAVLPDGRMDAYDGKDSQLTKKELEKFIKIIGLE